MAEMAAPRTSFGVPRREAVATSGRLGFGLLLLYMVVEYGRPQDLVPPLRSVPVGVLVALPLLGVLGRSLSRLEPLERIFLPYAALATVMAAWVPFAYNNFWAFQTFKTIVLYGIVLLAFVAFVTSSSRMRGVVRLWVALLALQGVHGLLAAGRGTGAYFGDENDYAMAMNLGLALVVFGFRAERGVAARGAFAAAGLLFVTGVVVSASRGGLVGLAATAGTVLVFSRHRLRYALLAAAAAAFLASMAPSSYWDEMATIFDTGTATRVERFRHWTIATEMFADQPLVGVGPGNAPWRAAEYEVFDTRVERSLAGRALHSAWFTLVAELGLVGVGLYGWIVVLALRSGFRARRIGGPAAASWASAFLTGSAAWATCGVFLSTLYYPHPYYLLAGLVAVRRIAEAEPEPGDQGS